MKVTVPAKTVPAKTVEITSCYHNCPYFGTEGGPSPTMVCNHPYWNNKGAYDNCIISHPECDTGFPPLCPLYRENGIEPPPYIKPKSNSDYLSEEEKKLSFKEQLDIIFERRLVEALATEIAMTKD